MRQATVALVVLCAAASCGPDTGSDARLARDVSVAHARAAYVDANGFAAFAAHDAPIRSVGEGQRDANTAQARAAYVDTSGLTWFAARAAARRSVFNDGPTIDTTPMLASMQAAAAAAWNAERFGTVDASRVPPAIKAAGAMFAEAIVTSRAGKMADYEREVARADALNQADVAATLPARFGPEIVLFVQRMVAGYTAQGTGLAAREAPAELARRIVRESRAATHVSEATVRAGKGGPVADQLRELRLADNSEFFAQRGLANLPPDVAQRLMAWNRSAEGRAYNDRVLAAWSRASDAACTDMLTRFFESMRGRQGVPRAERSARAG